MSPRFSKIHLCLASVAGSLLLAAASPLSAQSVPPPNAGPTVGELIKQCFSNVTNGSISDPVCTGYLAGFVGAVRIARTVSEDFPICLPEDGVTNDDIIAEVSAYLEANPDNVNNSARSVVFLVLTSKYPCF